MIGLYIHVPFCVKKCNYCDFNSYKIDEKSKKLYLNNLKKEMEIYKGELEDKQIDSIFLGGGTPSILNSQEIKEIFYNIRKNFKIRIDAEITMECNPGTLNLEKLKIMKEIGINRISIGLQATQNYHLKAIGRIHTYEEFVKNYQQAIDVGFKNINIDLMYCLPNQNIDEWKETLEKVTKLNPSHISAYSLILEEGTELYNMYERKEFEIIDEDTDINLYNYTIDYLKSKGYNQYEISNYAKEGYECKHNILYWKCKNYLGLGPGASGYVNNIRYNNVESIQEYNELLSGDKKPILSKELLSVQDKIEEKIFMGLRMNEGIKFDDFKNEFNIDFRKKYNKQLAILRERQLILEDKSGIKLTQKGREISNSIFIEFID
ncbi:oxygen-independent coproporphyrinogen III oxidase [Romboutsia maritimum]|uniref:Heme chaperone HemW n=1 Tax=Romboutsia maritimum TaxID=2020948 RepID=A0A371IU19_9FIRM|nr:radical SAM family heme chaperone HemW [Romboutsia maritimum]RDY23980.1 oxygen-independent coproporphyrinogen III oxidase [Romboutsia maritimum]